MKCFEDYRQGHLGYEDITNRGDEASELEDSLPVVDLGTGMTFVTLWGLTISNVPSWMLPLSNAGAVMMMVGWLWGSFS